MASPFNLSKSGKGKSGAGDYNALLKKNMARYRDRDEAVRKTNIATGHGNSTAQRFMHEGTAKPKAAGGGSGAGKKTDRRKTSSTARPTRSPTSAANTPPTLSPTSVSNSPPTMSPTSVSNSPPTRSPTSVANSPNSPFRFPPDLAVSPQRPPDPMAAGAPHGMGMSGTGYVPPVPSALPVSPQFPPDPMRGAPTNNPPQPDIGAPGQPIVGMGGPVGAGRPPVGMGGPVGAGRPPVGMGGPVGAGNPVISMPEGAPGRPPVGMGGASGAGQAPVGTGGASGAGGPVVDPSIIRWLLGLG